MSTLERINESKDILKRLDSFLNLDSLSKKQHICKELHIAQNVDIQVIKTTKFFIDCKERELVRLNTLINKN